MRETVVQLSSVTLRRGERTLLDTINWTVRAGKVTALVGPNGSGKSTLVSVIGGYSWPSEGEVRVLGCRFGETNIQDLRKRIGIVETSRAPSFAAGLSVREVVASGLINAFMIMHKEKITACQWEAVDAELEAFGLGGFGEVDYRVLSTGEKARCLMARAMVARPELLVLDEPSAGLDIAGRYELTRLMERLCQRPEAPSIILVTHHLDELPEHTEGAALIKDGAILCQGEMEAVLTDQNMSRAFDCDIQVVRHGGRYTALVVGKE